MEEKKVHYVCAGTCGGVSDFAKDCEDKSCNFYGQPMHECRCEDGLHREDIPAGAVPASA